MDNLNIDTYLESKAGHFLDQSKEWLRIPSVSCREKHKEDMDQLAAIAGSSSK